MDRRLRDKNVNDSIHVTGKMGEKYMETWKIALKIEYYASAEQQTILITYPVHVVVGEWTEEGSEKVPRKGIAILKESF